MTATETYARHVTADHADRYSDEQMRADIADRRIAPGPARAAGYLLEITGDNATALRSAAAGQGYYLMNTQGCRWADGVHSAVRDILAGRPFYEREADRIMRTASAADRRLADQALYAEAARAGIA